LIRVQAGRSFSTHGEDLFFLARNAHPIISKNFIFLQLLLAAAFFHISIRNSFTDYT